MDDRLTTRPQPPADDDISRLLGDFSALPQGKLLEKLVVPVTGSPRSVTRRALLTGFILVTLVAALAPYNDNVIQNAPLIGNHLPVGLFSVMMLFVLVVNPLLQKIKHHPYSPGELVVVFSLALVASAIPTSGLVRYGEPMLVSPFDLATRFPWLRPIANLIPNLLVPSKDPDSPIIACWLHGIDPVRGETVPVLAFLIPAFLWTILIAAIMGSAMFLANIFRKQWIHHERLSYPLATIPLELFAEPEKDNYFNPLLRNPILWTGAAIPLFLYALSGLHSLWPAVPEVSLQFNFSDAFSEHPWDLLPRYIVANRLYFAVVGITLFVPSDVAFSLVFFLLLDGFSKMFLQRAGIDPYPTESFRGIGAYLGYFTGILWLARGHLRYVITAAFHNTPREPDETTSYRTMVLGLIICNAVAAVWLWCMGMSWFAAVVLLLLGTGLITLMSRIIAETGIFFIGATWSPPTFLSSLLGHSLISTASYNCSNIISRIFYVDLRENLMPYATTSLRLGSEVQSSQKTKFLKSLFVALALSFVISACVNHYYSYALGRQTYGKDWESTQIPFSSLKDTYAYANQPDAVPLSTAWGQTLLGGGMLAVTMIGRVFFVSWPLHPVGLILMNSWPLQCFWFSIAMGWLVKTLMLHYGGAALFRRVRPFFVGLIVGELLAAGSWLLIGLAFGGAITFKLFPS